MQQNHILAALIELIDERIRVASSSPVRVIYSQIDGQRPPGVGRVRYLRGWRRGRDAGDPEVTADGRARLMTAGAWQRHGASVPSRARQRAADVAPVTREVDVLEELGLAGDERRRSA